MLAAEDVTGISPAQEGTTAKYADEVAASLRGGRRTSDVYDFDAMGRTAPHPLGVLSHYQAVVWETGDDVILRAPGQVPGTAARAALEIELAVRDYLNEGGKLLVSGKYALYAQGAERRVRRTSPTRHRSAPTPGTRPACRCSTTSSSTGWARTPTSATAAPRRDGTPYPVTGRRRGVRRLRGAAQRPRFGRQPGPHGVVPDHVELPAAGRVPAVRQLRSGGLGPAGRRAVRPAHRRVVPVQRAVRRVVQAADPHRRPDRRPPAASCASSSYDIEADWDFMFVEAHEVGSDDWTTLPDANGKTSTATGDSCQSGWAGPLHPFLRHYAAPTARPPAAPAPGTRPPALQRLAGVVGRPVGVRRQAGRGLHLVRLGLGHPGARRLPRRRAGDRRRRDGRRDLLRGRPRRLDGGRPAGRVPAERQHLQPRAAGVRQRLRGRHTRRRTRSSRASASRE